MRVLQSDLMGVHKLLRRIVAALALGFPFDAEDAHDSFVETAKTARKAFSQPRK